MIGSGPVRPSSKWWLLDAVGREAYRRAVEALRQAEHRGPSDPRRLWLAVARAGASESAWLPSLGADSGGRGEGALGGLASYAHERIDDLPVELGAGVAAQLNEGNGNRHRPAIGASGSHSVVGIA